MIMNLTTKNVVALTTFVMLLYSFGVASLAFDNIIFRKLIIIVTALHCAFALMYCIYLKSLGLPLCIFLMVFVNSLISGLLNNAELEYLSLDVSVILSVSLSLFYARYSSISDIKFLFLIVSVLSSFLYILYSVNDTSVFAVSTILIRGLTWNDSFYLASAFYLATYIFAYILIYKSRHLIFYIYIFLFIFSSIIVLKRAAIVQMLLVFILYMILDGGFRHRVYALFIVGAVCAYAMFMPYLDSLSPILVAVQERFSNISNDGIANFDRVKEFLIYFSSYDWPRIFFGSGLGVTQTSLGTENLAMHIGLFNIIFKFGVFTSLLLMLIILYAVFLTLTKYRTAPKEMKFYMLCFLSGLIPFFTFINMWDVLPSLFIFCVFMFKIIFMYRVAR